jgi:hypothetical protein
VVRIRRLVVGPDMHLGVDDQHGALTRPSPA